MRYINTLGTLDCFVHLVFSKPFLLRYSMEGVAHTYHEELTYYMHTHWLVIEFVLYEVVYILYQPAFTLKITE